MRSIVFGQSRTSFVCLWKEFFSTWSVVLLYSSRRGTKRGVMYPFYVPGMNCSPVGFWYFYKVRSQSTASQLSCNNMACILRIFCGCLRDKVHCLELYSSPREWAEFPSGTKVEYNTQVLTINSSQPQCYVFKMRRLKIVLGRASLSNSPAAWVKRCPMCSQQMPWACVKQRLYRQTDRLTSLWSQWEWLDYSGPRNKFSVPTRKSTMYCLIELTISKVCLLNTDCCHYKL